MLDLNKSIGYFANFEQVKNLTVILLALNKSISYLVKKLNRYFTNFEQVGYFVDIDQVDYFADTEQIKKVGCFF